MPSWNPMQLKAIQTKGKNILVSASAGSGKTTVLIARLMDLVMKDHICIDAILTMTFTEAAANEMKKRLASELQNAYSTAVSQAEKDYITKQLTSIQTAHISTIHAFCLSIIQEYYYMIGLDPQRINHIMDNGTMVIYQQRALQEAFEKQYQLQDPVFLQLCQMFSPRPESDATLSQTILNLATLVASKSDPQAWLNKLALTYDEVFRFEDLPQNIYDNFFEYLYVEEQRYEELLEKIDEIFCLNYPDQVKKYAVIQQKRAALPSLRDALHTKDYASYRNAFISIAHAVVPPSPDKEDKQYAQLRKQIATLEDTQVALLFSEDDYMRDLRKLHPYIHKLIEVCNDYRTIYATLKEVNKVIDFDDMEHFALTILQTKNHQVADIYRSQFVEIMVDEFQDSNDVQNQLVRLICKENNVFRVGDIKQSIYGFRHAKPQLMQGLIEEKGTHDEVIYLSNNYRSKKMIVDFNNVLYNKLMNIDGFSCSYTKEDDVETGISTQLENNAPICFHAIFHHEIKEQEQLALSKNEIKASYIANQILAIKEQEQRTWKDFVVLVRGNARKDDMKKVFDDLHIPYFIDIKHGFYQSNAVQMMLSALSCIYQPHHDISFVATVLSPLFQMSTTDLAQANLARDKKQSYYSYYKANPVAEFLILQDFIREAQHASLTEILNRLYDLHDYYSLHTTIQEKTNLDLLFEKAVAYEDQFATGIAAFLSKIAQIKEAQTAEAIPIGSEADVVRVMSIHQSKGLQFPVVFLWSNDKQTPIEFKDFCINDSELGIAMKWMDLPQRYVRTTIPRIAMEHKKNKEELEEEMRILYVATTRAQEQMHIVDCIASLAPYEYPLSMSSVYDRNGYTAWILQVFMNQTSHVFTMKEVHSYWENQMQPKQVTPHKPLQKYRKPSFSVQLTTASAEKEEALPIFMIDKDTSASDYGTMMHKMIEHLPKTAPWLTKDITVTAEALQVTLHHHDRKTLQLLGEDPIYVEATHAVSYHELPFMVKDGDHIVHGFIDFMAIQDNNITVIDFKTDALSTDEEFMRQYKKQLAVYKRAMELLYPKAYIRCYIYALHLHKMISVN